MLVHRKHGVCEELDVEKLIVRISGLCDGLDNEVDPAEVALRASEAAESGIKASELIDLAARKAADLWHEHPDYLKLAGRIAVSQLQRQAPATFSQNMRRISLVRRDPGWRQVLPVGYYRVILEHAGLLNAAVKNELDFEYDWPAYEVLERDYLTKDSLRNNIMERPQQMWMRRSVMSNAWDLDSVLLTYKLLSQKSIVLPPLQYVAVSGMSRRPAGEILPMPIWSVRLMEFLFEAKSGCAENEDVDSALDDPKSTLEELLKRVTLIVPDLFLKRVQEVGMWSLLDQQRAEEAGGKLENFASFYEQCESGGVFVERIEAQALWKKILMWQSTLGHPRLVFMDSSCRVSTVLSVLSNPADAAFEELSVAMNVETKVAARNGTCINLPKFVSSVKQGGLNRTSRSEMFDFSALHGAAKLVTRMVNHMVDHDYARRHTDHDMEDLTLDPILFGVGAILGLDDDNGVGSGARARLHGPRRPPWRAIKRRRPICICVTGLADALVDLKIAYESDDARVLCRKIFETVYHAALEASCELAKEYAEPMAGFKETSVGKGVLLPDAWGVPLTDELWNWTELRRKIAENGLRNSTVLSLSIPPSLQHTFSALLDHPSTCILPFAPIIDATKLNSGTESGQGREDAVRSELAWNVNPRLVRDLKEAGLWSGGMAEAVAASGSSIQHIDGIPDALKAIHKTAWQIPPESVLEMAAAAAPFIGHLRPVEVMVPKASIDGEVEQEARRPTNDQVELVSRLQMRAWELGLPTGVIIREISIPEPRVPQEKEEVVEKSVDPDADDCLASDSEDEVSSSAEEPLDSAITADGASSDADSTASQDEISPEEKQTGTDGAARGASAAEDDILDAMYRQAITDFVCAVLPPHLTPEQTAKIYKAVEKLMEDMRKAVQMQADLMAKLYDKKVDDYVGEFGRKTKILDRKMRVIEECGGFPLPSEDGQLEYLCANGKADVAGMIREDIELNQREHARAVLVFNVKTLPEELEGETGLKGVMQRVCQCLGVPFPPETEVKRIGFKTRPLPIRIEFPEDSGITGKEVVKNFWAKRQQAAYLLNQLPVGRSVAFSESRSHFFRLRLTNMYQVMRELGINFPLLRPRVHGGWACSFRGTDYFSAYAFTHPAIKLSDGTVIPLRRVMSKQKYALIVDPDADFPGPDEDVKKRVEEESDGLTDILPDEEF